MGPSSENGPASKRVRGGDFFRVTLVSTSFFAVGVSVLAVQTQNMLSSVTSLKDDGHALAKKRWVDFAHSTLNNGHQA